MIGAWIVPGVVAVLLLAAEDPVGAARARARAATAAYNLGHYAESAREYEEAYKLVQDPNFLFNLGQAYRLGHEPDKALTTYRSFLRTTPADDPNRDPAQRRIDELERMAAASPRAEATSVERRGVAPMPPSPTVTAVPVAYNQDTPPYRRWWVWTAVGAVAAGIVAAILISHGRNGNDCQGINPCGTLR